MGRRLPARSAEMIWWPDELRTEQFEPLSAVIRAGGQDPKGAQNRLTFRDAAYAAAIAFGGTDEGSPGLHRKYAADYYGAYVRDPESNKLHFVTRGA